MEKNILIGVIAEGREDQAVIRNIFRAFGFDGSQIRSIRPSLSKDNTDLSSIKVEINDHRGFELLYSTISSTISSIGTWQGVKNACISRADFKRFWKVEGSEYMVVHLDTAEIDATDTGITRPPKNGNPKYCQQLRSNTINAINNWLQNHYKDKLFYAICIEEMEAWILTIYENQDTSTPMSVKNKLSNTLKKKNISTKGCSDVADFYEEKAAKAFRKRKDLEKFVQYNQSLSDFVDSIKNALK